MIYAIYRVFEDDPNKGFYWGKYEDPVILAYACYNLAKLNLYDIKIVTYTKDEDILAEVTW